MKKVLITGASGNLGSAIATKIASELKKNVLLILHSHNNLSKAEVLAKKLTKKFGCKTEIVQADLSNLEETENLCKDILKKYKVIDILINNAAIVVDVDLEERTKEMFVKTLNCNLTSPFILSKNLGLVMNKKGAGKIVNISSTNGMDENSPFSIDYDASKAGLINLTKNFAIAFPELNVNCVAPQWIKTQMNDDLGEEYLKAEANALVKGRFATAEEVAELVWFLLSDKADYLTGQIYTFGNNRI